MRPRTEHVTSDRGHRLAVDDESGRRYVVVGMQVGATEFDGYYEVPDEQYARFAADPAAAGAFAEQCRRHEHDDLLKLGWRSSSGIS